MFPNHENYVNYEKDVYTTNYRHHGRENGLHDD